MTASAMEINALLDRPDYVRDPYPAYRALLSLDSPFWCEARGAWLISRHEQVVGTFRDWPHFSSAGRVGALLDHFSEEDWKTLEGLRRWTDLRGIIHADPPEHTRFRALFTRAFTTKAVGQLRPRVETLVDELLAPVLEKREFDIVNDLALPLPAAVISHILGVPDADRSNFVSWSDAALGIQGRQRPTLEVARRASDAYAALQDYFADLIHERRRDRRMPRPDEDFVTGLIRMTDDDPAMSEADVIQSCITLLMGGYETTTSLISNTMVVLLQRPELFAAVKADPTLLPVTIEESLRFECPIQTITRRVNGNLQLGNASLEAGDLSILMMGAANRDPRKFIEPDEFDITRTDRHLAFGYGIHLCVGAALARMEAPVAVGRMLTRLPGLALNDHDIDWNEEKPVTRCPSTLVAHFHVSPSHVSTR